MRIVVSGYVGKKITGIGRNLICLLDNSSSNNEYIIANVDNTPKYNAAKLLWSVFGYYHGSRILIKLKRIIT